MNDETNQFLLACGFTVNKINPRQYVAEIPTIPKLEVWFQRSADVVRKVRDGDVDLGIVGLDTVVEYQGSDESVVVIHDHLGYGQCYLAVAVPESWTDIHSMADLAALAQSRHDSRPLRVVSKFQRQAAAFLEKHHVKPCRLLYADGALEAGPQMGTADFIVDLVSSGVTLRENRLKQLVDGKLLESQAVFVGNRAALTQRPDVLAMARDMLERFEAHLRAIGQMSVVANIRGMSAEEVAQKVFSQPDLGGLQGPTISPVYLREPGPTNWYAISVVVAQKKLTHAIKQLRQIGGSGVLVLPVTYIFDEEPPRWRKLVQELNLNPEE